MGSRRVHLFLFRTLNVTLGIQAAKIGNIRDTRRPLGAQDLGWPQGSPEKSPIFKPVFRATKAMKISPKATQNHEKMTTRIMRNPISAKADFCNTSDAKCLFFQSQTPRFGPTNHQKKKPGDKHEKTHFLIQST